mgnify:CR=1 FL=1
MMTVEYRPIRPEEVPDLLNLWSQGSDAYRAYQTARFASDPAACDPPPFLPVTNPTITRVFVVGAGPFTVFAPVDHVLDHAPERGDADPTGDKGKLRCRVRWRSELPGNHRRSNAKGRGGRGQG